MSQMRQFSKIKRKMEKSNREKEELIGIEKNWILKSERQALKLESIEFDLLQRVKLAYAKQQETIHSIGKEFNK